MIAKDRHNLIYLEALKGWYSDVIRFEKYAEPGGFFQQNSGFSAEPLFAVCGPALSRTKSFSRLDPLLRLMSVSLL